MRQFPFLIVTTIFVSSLCHADVMDNYTVCTSEDCPTISAVLNPNETLNEQVIIYQSTKNDGFMRRREQEFANTSNGGWQYIVIDQSKFVDTYPVIGFGGAFTDTASHLFHHMTENLQNKMLMAYFSAQGIRYSVGRVPMASNDFSCRKLTENNGKLISLPSLTDCDAQASQYSYADEPDNDLTHFALASEDINYKIPMIHAAQHMATRPLRLFASPWSAPAWMKTNNTMIQGSLLSPFQSIWANYFVKFLKAYQRYGIRFWGVTVQNEPVESELPGQNGLQTWQTMYYTKEQEGAFIKDYLGPALKSLEKDYGSPILLIAHDDQISSIADRMSMMSDPDIAKYVAGAGLHWYINYPGFSGRLDSAYQALNQAIPNQPRFILATEACQGYLPPDRGPILGDWSRGEGYAHDIINDFNHHVSGWVDWNLVLDKAGGPSWAKNFVDSPMLVDLATQSLVFQPMYYYLGHFSKFVLPDSKMLASESKGWFALEEVAFKVQAQDGLPDTIVVIVLNRDMTGRKYYLEDHTQTSIRYLNMEIPAHSIQTIIYRAERTN